MFRSLALTIGLVAALATPLFTTNLFAVGSADAEVYVIHGIPGIDVGLDPELPVDITVNGGCALENFRFGDIAGPLFLPEGNYTIDIRPANLRTPCSEMPLFSVNVDLVAGENATR